MVQTIGEVPIPITSVENKQITRSSNVRLNETLTEQAGLLVNSDHGTDTQIQGLNS